MLSDTCQAVRAGQMQTWNCTFLSYCVFCAPMSNVFNRIHTRQFSSPIQLYLANGTTSLPFSPWSRDQGTASTYHQTQSACRTVLNSEFLFVAPRGKVLICWPSIPLHCNYWCAGVFLGEVLHGSADAFCTSFLQKQTSCFFPLSEQRELVWTGFPKPHQPAVDFLKWQCRANVS